MIVNNTTFISPSYCNPLVSFLLVRSIANVFYVSLWLFTLMDIVFIALIKWSLIIIMVIIIRTFIHSANKKQAAINNCWRDKSSNAWKKTEQTVRVFSAQQVNCSMWLERPPRNFGYQWTSLFLGREVCQCARPQLPTTQKSGNRLTKLTQIRRRQTMQTLVNQHGGFEYN